jgi:P27 family predicted phage terminase small subunit
MAKKAVSVSVNRGTFPRAPKSLNATGKKAWDMGIQLWADGTILERDLFNWQIFCEAVEEKETCEQILKEHGEYQLAPNGCYAQHPALKRRQQAENVIRKYSILFGMLPEARKKRPSVAQGVAQRKR